MYKTRTTLPVGFHRIGGLALTATQVGVINGTIGVLCLLAGGIAGGVIIAKRGLRKCMWPMAAALALPCGVYCYLAMWRPIIIS